MSQSEIEILKMRIRELEEDLQSRHNDLAIYRSELVKANQVLQDMILQTQAQLNWALKIQNRLVPTAFPNINGFDFSTKFLASAKSGSDYFDIFEHRDKMRFGILISSSTGYGMSALFLSIILKLSMEMEENKGKNPDVVLEQIRSEMEADNNHKENSHVFYGVVDRRTYELTYSSAGDVVALHYDNSSKKLSPLHHDVDPISVRNKNKFSRSKVNLNSKDKLILCSPGFVNVTNLEEESFGFDQILASVKSKIDGDVHELRNELFFRAEQFSQGVTYPKDLTAIVMEVKDRVIKLASANNAES